MCCAIFWSKFEKNINCLIYWESQQQSGHVQDFPKLLQESTTRQFFYDEAKILLASEVLNSFTCCKNEHCVRLAWSRGERHYSFGDQILLLQISNASQQVTNWTNQLSSLQLNAMNLPRVTVIWLLFDNFIYYVQKLYLLFVNFYKESSIYSILILFSFIQVQIFEIFNIFSTKLKFSPFSLLYMVLSFNSDFWSNILF